MYDRNPKNRKQAGVLKLPAENGGMKMATLYIVRHGETEWNKRRKVQGHADIPLNEYGKYLAEETAKGLKIIRFDCAYTSPLKRAKQTAQIILGEQAAPLYEDCLLYTSTALYAYLIAKHEAGDFILRVEDTDQERFVDGALEIIYRTLEKTGLYHDEGPDKDLSLIHI